MNRTHKIRIALAALVVALVATTGVANAGIVQGDGGRSVAKDGIVQGDGGRSVAPR